MHLKILLIPLLLALSPITQAADWVFVSSSDDGTKYYIDVENITKDKKMINYWVLAELPASERISDGSKTFKSKKDKHIANCQTKEFGIEFQVNYSGSMGTGNTVNFMRYSGALDPIPPGTVGEKIINFACSIAKKIK